MQYPVLSFAARRGKLSGPARAIAAAIATLGIALAAFAQHGASPTNPDWPCQQILVSRIALAAVWSGPPVEGVAWQKDPAVAALVAEVAPRRMPLEEAERRIEEFAHAQGAAKADKLVAVFAGVFETLNAERAQVIDGLLRFGAKQRELAAKIRAHSHPAMSESSGQQDKDDGSAELNLDLRLFEERRQSLSFVCESPTLIEQRLFALARIIQRNLE